MSVLSVIFALAIFAFFAYETYSIIRFFVVRHKNKKKKLSESDKGDTDNK